MHGIEQDERQEGQKLDDTGRRKKSEDDYKSIFAFALSINRVIMMVGK